MPSNFDIPMWIERNSDLIDVYDTVFGDSVYIFTVYGARRFIKFFKLAFPQYECKRVGTVVVVSTI